MGEEIEAWAGDLGDDGVKAATRVQALQRGKQSRKEVEEKRKALEAELEAAKKEQEEIEAWAGDLGDDGVKAATHVQALQRGKQSRKEVEEKRKALEAELE